MHQHDEHCGCGEHHHAHEHGENCGCGERHHGHHHHEHGENCGCGHDHTPVAVPEGLSPMQVDILLALRQRQCLPVACFTFANSGDDTRRATALAPVYLGTPDDSMEQVKQLGGELIILEDMDLITLDYDLPIRDYPYDEYKNSALYAYFVKTVEEGALRPGAAFDTPELELGSMALTEAGEDMVDALVGQP